MISTKKYTDAQRQEAKTLFLGYFEVSQNHTVGVAHQQLGPVFSRSLTHQLKSEPLARAFRKALDVALADNSPAALSVLLDQQAKDQKTIDCHRKIQTKDPRKVKSDAVRAAGKKLARSVKRRDQMRKAA